ncbi:MAG: HD-GYP domain-containing protein [Anaerolineae bacterium]
MKLTLLSKFSLLSFLFMAATGLILGWALTKQLERTTLNQAAREAGAQVDRLISPLLEGLELEYPLDSDSYAEIDRVVREAVLSESIVRVKIWNTRGVVVYSNATDLVGRSFPVEEDLERALDGEFAMKISDLTAEEHVEERGKFARLMEIYVPILSPDSGRVIGVYEVYHTPDHLKEHIDDSRRVLWSGLVMGFGALYVGLFGIVRSASQTLVKQNIELERLTESLGHSLKDLERSYLGTVEALRTAVEVKDKYTAGHSQRVAEYAVQLGRLAGLSEEELKSLEEAALFHDIGKIGIPEEILNKPGRLTDDEYQMVKAHPQRGEEILKPVPFMEDRIPLVRHHHERYDGSGYPDGLRGEEIPLGARILLVADTFDALTSSRAYRPAYSQKEAISILLQSKGTQLDPRLVDLFVDWLQGQDEIAVVEPASRD